MYEIQDMPYDEFTKWHQYFERRPLGWREDERTLKLLQIQGFKGDPSEVFSSLAKLKSAESNATAAGIKGLQGSMMYNLMLSAVGGDKIS